MEALGWGWIHTIPCSLQYASLLGQKPLLVGAGQDIHGDAVVLLQRAEIDHNILYLLVSQRDSNLKREEKSSKWEAPFQTSYQGGQGPVRLAPPFSLVLSTATPSSHPRSLLQEHRALSWP